ncbi:hypothetical protein D3C75_1246800 [compost metagenome]
MLLIAAVQHPLQCPESFHILLKGCNQAGMHSVPQRIIVQREVAAVDDVVMHGIVGLRGKDMGSEYLESRP